MVGAGEVEKEEKKEVEQEAGKQRGAGTECLTWTDIQLFFKINPLLTAPENSVVCSAMSLTCCRKHSLNQPSSPSFAVWISRISRRPGGQVVGLCCVIVK